MRIADIKGPKDIVFHINVDDLSSVTPSTEGVHGTQTLIAMKNRDQFYTPMTPQEVLTALQAAKTI